MFEETERTEVVKQALSKLSEREQKILQCRYGKGLSLEDTGKEVGLTRERVRQIEQIALGKLKQIDEELHLTNYL